MYPLPSCLLELDIGLLLPVGLEFSPSFPSSQAFWTQTELYCLLYWVSSLQRADHGTAQPPESCEPILPQNKSPHI